MLSEEGEGSSESRWYLFTSSVLEAIFRELVLLDCTSNIGIELVRSKGLEKRLEEEEVRESRTEDDCVPPRCMVLEGFLVVLRGRFTV